MITIGRDASGPASRYPTMSWICAFANASWPA